MDAHSPLLSILFFLAAAVVAVPLFKKIKLGAILGYLVAGVVLGPSGVNLISHPESILHFSEIGVVLLLFVIGLELQPDKLWSMRQHIALLGVGQLLISASIIFLLMMLFISGIEPAIVIGLALALSSTAFAIQLMSEKGILASPAGRRGFAILLLQDLAVIPILLITGLLAKSSDTQAVEWYWSFLAVVGLLLAGRYLLNPLLKLASRYGNRETMTSASLLIVIGAAALMQYSGLSMGLGAFVAGIMLANSSFRHQLESDIEPFKGITLGLFFIAIGMTLDLQLLMQSPLLIFTLAIGLMLIKTLVILELMSLSKVEWRQGLKVALMLSQGGEFAFVVMGQATSGQILPLDVAAQVNLVVGLSMALTAPLVIILDAWSERFPTNKEGGDRPLVESPHYDEHPEVLILGFGRFGQTTGRILAANKIPFVAIDKDAEHIDFVRRFGNKVFFGDATRLDVLHTAGIEHAKVALVAIDDAQATEEVVELIQQHYPQVKVIARARNRAAYWALRNKSTGLVIREIFAGSLEAANETLVSIGYSTSQALRVVKEFESHDKSMIEHSLEHVDNLDKLIEIGRKGRSDLERLFTQDSEAKAD